MNISMAYWHVLIAYLLFFSPTAFSADWTSYAGNHRDHHSSEKGLRTEWGNEEPAELWRIKIGAGYSSVIEWDGMAYCQGNENGKNTLFCVNSQTGEVIWTHQYPCRKDPKFFQGGSRATPLIHEKTLYLPSHEGDLYALNAKDGKILWSLNIIKDLKGIRPDWGYSGCPLVAEGKVIFETGSPEGSLVALNSQDGSLVWRGGSHEAGYASPVIRKSTPNEILLFNQFGLSVHDFKNGNELKTYQHKTRFGVNAAQPLDLGDTVLVTSAYGKGGALVDLKASIPQAIWESEAISCQMSSLVHLDGHAYGIHGQAGGRSASQSTLFCLRIDRGKKVWEKKGYGLGSLILVDGTLVMLTENGELVLCEASPRKFTELASFQVLSGKANWTPPTYSNGKMHCRSSRGDWVCLRMSQSSVDSVEK